MTQEFRVPHIMKKHISNRMPASLLYFDTETKTIKTPDETNISRQSLKFGFAYYYRYEDGKKTREKWCRFTTSEQFFKFLQSATDKNRPLYCFAHNLGFDLTILDFWRWSERENFQVEYFVLQDPPTFIIGRLDDKKIVFIDTLNYWRTSLAKIGESLGLSKLDRPTPQSNTKYWNDYGKRDVEILALAIEGLVQYVQSNDLGQFGLSAASMAMSTFKHRFMKHDIFIHANTDVMEIERRCYYGGFTHCFYVGKVRSRLLYKLDVNSMYPFVMRQRFPCKHIATLLQPTRDKIRQLLQEKGICAQVTISSNTETYPVYVAERLCYCRGTFTTYLAGPELRRALNNGHVTSIPKAAIYDLHFLFRDYIDFFWAERQRYKREGNEVNQIFIKLFMNMLAGKFGQLGYDTTVLTPSALKRIYDKQGKIMPLEYNDPLNLFTDFANETDWKPKGLTRPVTLRRINNAIQIKVPNGEHSESFPAIAAYVTSYARELLWSYIKIAGPRSVYYCDTDSLFVDLPGFTRLGSKGVLSPTELGMLKLEGSARDSEFWCPKDYKFNEIATRKGIRKDAEQISETEFKQIQFEGIKSVLKRGYQPYIDVATITKKNTRKFTKGIIGEDHWVIPFTLPLPLEQEKRIAVE